ncbi:hypothetical protein U1839_24215 [Sphingomonas sp. RT2P30]|uniref:hypothetical protein n=1 Tax=Parasphingomonas halimpatiens TaxID=3096162 RepID=UPI002FC5C282
MIAGLEQIVRGDQIPEAWVNAFIADTRGANAHLYEADIFQYLIGQEPDWMDHAQLNPHANHWDVVLGVGQAAIHVTTNADGDCGVHAIHAVINRAMIQPDDAANARYVAPAAFVAQVRGAIAAMNDADRDEVRARILHEIQNGQVIAETGFGPSLAALLEAHIAAARAAPKPGLPDPPAPRPSAAGSNIIDEASGGAGGQPVLPPPPVVSSAAQPQPSGGSPAVSGAASSGGSAIDVTRNLIRQQGAVAREDDRAGAIRILGDVYTRMDFCSQYRGAYAEVWADQANEELLNDAMKFIAILRKWTLVLCDKTGPLSDREASIFNTMISHFERFQQKLERAQRAVSLAARDAAAGAGEAPSAVRQLVARAGGRVPAHGFVIPRRLYDALRPLVEQYEPAWNKAGTDGLKGMRYDDFAAIEKLRQRIAEIVLADDSASADVIAAFADQLSRLAAQSCSSRDVQYFHGWFTSHRGGGDG